MFIYGNCRQLYKWYSMRVASRGLCTEAISKIEKLSLSYYCYNPKYLTEKDCKPVIALHGLYTSKEYFYDISATLAKKLQRPIYAVDLRDHGESPHGKYGARATLMIIAEDIRHFMDELAIAKAVLIGYGLGGRAMVQFAQLNECRTEKVVTIDVSQEGSLMFSKSFPKQLHHLDEVNLTNNSNLGYVRLLMKSILREHIKSPYMLKFVLDNIRLDSEGKFQWRFNVPVLEQLLNNWTQVKQINYGDYRCDGQLLNIVTKNNYITSEDYLDFKTNFKRCQVEHLRSRYMHTNKMAFINSIAKFVHS